MKFKLKIKIKINNNLESMFLRDVLLLADDILVRLVQLHPGVVVRLSLLNLLSLIIDR